ncbi:MAG: DNA-processing protein DprA [Syntrophomonadaceae bacterium]|jgi:DNA processing protein|nr:DNA-processing protein DprA [Syntrophomonadaceae bacterium]
MNDNERISLAILHTITGIGSAALGKIKTDFGGFHECLMAGSERLERAFPAKDIQNEIQGKRSLGTEYFYQKIDKNNIKIITQEDDEYPDCLFNIGQPPYVLYCRGDTGLLKQRAGIRLGIVGSRKASAYGRNVAYNFARELALHDVCVISGLARGIDTEAHRGSLAERGKTIAVLGCGIDIIYPRENYKMYDKIAEQGLLLSEFPLGTAPVNKNFPRRNRIIAGLSKGIIVVEADKHSGAIITADFALEQGKDVFAVPGPINSLTSAGTNNLIKQGAALVTEITDILREYMTVNAAAVKNTGQMAIELSEEEKNVFKHFDFVPIHIEKLLDDVHIPIGKLSEILLKLEMNGLLKLLPGNYYIKSMDN